MMKRLFFTFSILIILAFSIFAQNPKPTPKGAKANLAKNNKLALKEKDDFEKARALANLDEKITALQKFAEDYPKSNDRVTALEIVVSTRAQLGDEKLRAGENEAGLKFFKDAVTDAPVPMSEKLFADVVLQFPTNLLALNQPAGAVEVAKMIEEKVSDNAKQLTAIAAFFVAIEKSAEAKRIAQKAIDLDPTLPVAYQTLGIANRLNFDFEESANAYAKALELDPNSVVSKRNLAEMKRAIGKADEAVTLYQELVEKDTADIQANNGLILSLFDADKREEAEAALNKYLEATPNNVVLLTGAAYWYAAHNNADKAIELSQKAIDIEPRYVWSRIAQARGLMLRNQPLQAEKVLLVARQYGDFPTLDYELATARFQAGLFEEAAKDLKRRFYVKDNYVQTYIAGRVAKEAESFTELLGLERQATIFTPKAADDAETSEKVKRLLDLSLKIENKETTEEDLTKAVDEFTKGDDKMKMHRQLYAANRLVEAKKDLPKALELTQNATKGVDASLEVNNPSVAVLADELLESRTIAISRGEIINPPDVPRQTLSRIVRGRIEELAGWTLYEQDKSQEAIVRFKRALSILPEKSSFWRSCLWRLGKAQFALGNLKEALDSYVKSYVDGPPDRFRRSTIEVVYRRINGNADGLDKLIGPNPFEEVAQATETPSPSPTAEASPTPVVTETPSPSPTAEPSPETKAEVSPTPESSPKVEVTPTPQPTVESTPTPEVAPETKATVSPTPQESPKVETTPTVEPTVEVKPTPSPTSETKPTPTPEVKTETIPTPTPTPEIKTEGVPTPTPEVKTETSPTPQVSPTVENKVEITSSLPSENKTEPTKSPTQKPLFDPIVINVPKADTSNPAKGNEKATETKEAEKKEDESVKPSEKKETVETEKKETEKPKENEQVAENTNKVSDSLSRPRVVTDKPAETEKTEPIPSCLVASQESLSILSNGGNLGLLVGYVGEGEISKIKAESNHPNDVVVNLEPGIGKQSNRAFFVIKSISDNKGVFTVTFTSPCGKKQVQVRVR